MPKNQDSESAETTVGGQCAESVRGEVEKMSRGSALRADPTLVAHVRSALLMSRPLELHRIAAVLHRDKITADKATVQAIYDELCRSQDGSPQQLTTREKLQRLALSSALEVRIAVAANPETPRNDLKALGQDADDTQERVKEALLANPSTPDTTIADLVDGYLTTSTDPAVPRGVINAASNRSTTAKTLEDIFRRYEEAEDEPNATREQALTELAANPNCPVWVLDALGCGAFKGELAMQVRVQTRVCETVTHLG